MDKEKVLLTDNEIAALSDDSEETVCKAQCRKLLALLKEPCKHTLYAGPGRTIRRVTRLIDCPKCMAQIEELLK